VRASEALAPLRCVGVDTEGEAWVVVADLLGRVGGVVADRGAERGIRPSEAVEGRSLDRSDAEPAEPRVRLLDRWEEGGAALVVAVAGPAARGGENEIVRASPARIGFVRCELLAQGGRQVDEPHPRVGLGPEHAQGPGR
jgi:hypothetical protein